MRISQAVLSVRYRDLSISKASLNDEYVPLLSIPDLVAHSGFLRNVLLRYQRLYQKHEALGLSLEEEKVLAKTVRQAYFGKQIEDLAFYRQLRCSFRQDTTGPKRPER